MLRLLPWLRPIPQRISGKIWQRRLCQFSRTLPMVSFLPLCELLYCFGHSREKPGVLGRMSLLKSMRLIWRNSRFSETGSPSISWAQIPKLFPTQFSSCPTAIRNPNIVTIQALERERLQSTCELVMVTLTKKDQLGLSPRLRKNSYRPFYMLLSSCCHVRLPFLKSSVNCYRQTNPSHV